LVLRNRIEIADRLLIYVADAPDTKYVTSNLATLVVSGTRERDAKRFNRFRLVLLSPQPEAATEAANDVFCRLKADDKVHLHVISDKAFPL
jgi:hypothetical protein